MFEQPLSRAEHWWLISLRLIWHYRDDSRNIIALVDTLLIRAEMRPCALPMLRLLEQLVRDGADHLYIERFDQPGVTGDERDLLAALKAMCLDDPFAAEHAMGALLPPGGSAAAMRRLHQVAIAGQRQWNCALAELPEVSASAMATH